MTRSVSGAALQRCSVNSAEGLSLNKISSSERQTRRRDASISLPVTCCRQIRTSLQALGSHLTRTPCCTDFLIFFLLPSQLSRTIVLKIICFLFVPLRFSATLRRETIRLRREKPLKFAGLLFPFVNSGCATNQKS